MARKKTGDGIGYTAAEWNRHEDAADYVAQRSLGSGGGDAARLLRTDIIRIKNSSGAARRKGEILKVGNLLISDSLILKEAREQLRFDTAIHDGTDAPFCVLLDPIPDGGRGRAQVAGICPALVNFAHADMKFARPDPAGTDVLMADVLGPVHILHKPSGTGEKECLVIGVMIFASACKSSEELQFAAFQPQISGRANSVISLKQVHTRVFAMTAFGDVL